MYARKGIPRYAGSQTWVSPGPGPLREPGGGLQAEPPEYTQTCTHAHTGTVRSETRSFLCRGTRGARVHVHGHFSAARYLISICSARRLRRPAPPTKTLFGQVFHLESIWSEAGWGERNGNKSLLGSRRVHAGPGDQGGAERSPCSGRKLYGIVCRHLILLCRREISRAVLRRRGSRRRRCYGPHDFYHYFTRTCGAGGAPPDFCCSIKRFRSTQPALSAFSLSSPFSQSYGQEVNFGSGGGKKRLCDNSTDDA